MTHLIEQPNENFEKTDTFTNTIILLDLSSRVRLPNQDRKDIAILQQIVDVFEANQRVYGFQISRDKLDIKIIKEALKKVWKDSIGDMNFDILDFQDLCFKFGFSPMDILVYDQWIVPKMSKQATNNSNYQLV